MEEFGKVKNDKIINRKFYQPNKIKALVKYFSLL